LLVSKFFSREASLSTIANEDITRLVRFSPHRSQAGLARRFDPITTTEVIRPQAPHWYSKIGIQNRRIIR